MAFIGGAWAESEAYEEISELGTLSFMFDRLRRDYVDLPNIDRRDDAKRRRQGCRLFGPRRG